MAVRRVVATVTLVGLGPGVPVLVDDDDPQVARWLRGGQLRYDDEAQLEVEVESDPQVETSPPARKARK